MVDYADGKSRINSAKGRVKARNVREDAPMATPPALSRT
jgi:hypothetical protein